MITPGLHPRFVDVTTKEIVDELYLKSQIDDEDDHEWITQAKEELKHREEHG